MVQDIWARHEYMTLAATMLSNKIATLALSPGVRPGLIRRTRRYIREGFPRLQRWIESQQGGVRVVAPDAAAIAFLGYDLEMGSMDLVERLRREHSVLVVPGEHFGLERFMRVSFGLPHDILAPALDRIGTLFAALRRGGAC